MNKLALVSFLTIISFSLAGCKFSQSADGNHVMVTSISSDGHYAITTNMNQHAYLWNLQNKTYKDIDDSVNIYSAYFIKGTDNFMYQKNGSNDVIIKNIAGDTVRQFNPGFASYGEIMDSKLSTYVGSDQKFNIYMFKNGKKQRILSYYCPPDLPKNDPPKQPKASIWGCMSFMGAGKLFNLAFSPDENTIIGTSYGYLVLWGAESGNLKKIVQKTNAQTVNAISPNGKYVVVADEQTQGLVYNLDRQSVEKVSSDGVFYYAMPMMNALVKSYFYDKENYRTDNIVNQVTAIKFIDDQHFVASINGMPTPFLYLGLYKLNDFRHKIVGSTPVTEAKLTKYLPLISKNFDLYVNQTKPYPETTSFVRDQAMDTSPSAHVLVMGQANRGGIMVYKYNPGDQTLKLVWSPTLETPQSN